MNEETANATWENFALYAIAITIEELFPELLTEEEIMTIAKETIKAANESINQKEKE